MGTEGLSWVGRGKGLGSSGPAKERDSQEAEPRASVRVRSQNGRPEPKVQGQPREDHGGHQVPGKAALKSSRTRTGWWVPFREPEFARQFPIPRRTWSLRPKAQAPGLAFSWTDTQHQHSARPSCKSQSSRPRHKPFPGGTRPGPARAADLHRRGYVPTSPHGPARPPR